MIRFVSLLLILHFSLFSQTADEVIRRTRDKLSEIQTLAYTSHHFIKGRYQDASTDVVKMYFEMTREDTIIGAKFEFDSSSRETDPAILVYNGKNLMSYYPDQEYLVTDPVKSPRDLWSIYHVSGSMLRIKQLLETLDQHLFNDVRLSDTLIHSRPCRSLKFAQTDDIQVMPRQKLTDYIEIIIDRANYLPLQLGRVTKTYTEKTSYSDMVINEKRPDDIWSEYRFPSSITIFSNDEFRDRKRVLLSEMENSDAVNWVLQDSDEHPFSLSDYSGRFVLLEFFAAGCGGHISSIPVINEIRHHYSEMQLKIIGIETNGIYPEGMKKYIREYQITYPCLLGNRELAGLYNVWASPTYFLISPQGRIVYASTGLYPNKLRDIIKKQLNL